MKQSKDNLFNQPRENQPFTFDKRVAAVFDDMIQRSVPGYEQILKLLPTLVQNFQMPNKAYYDLGCSLGAGMVAMAEGLGDTKAKIIGVDNSQAMIHRAETNIVSYAESCSNPLILQHGNITQHELLPAAMVLMNFTLQFIPLEQRDDLITKIYSSLADGGALVLSEKVKFAPAELDALLTEIHHQYKSDQGYSDLEIAQKRDAIENVLIPETLQAHQQRLQNAGFSIITPWLQNLQFISILAVK